MQFSFDCEAQAVRSASSGSCRGGSENRHVPGWRAAANAPEQDDAIADYRDRCCGGILVINALTARFARTNWPASHAAEAAPGEATEKWRCEPQA
jgi:hypothetical protein